MIDEMVTKDMTIKQTIDKRTEKIITSNNDYYGMARNEDYD